MDTGASLVKSFMKAKIDVYFEQKRECAQQSIRKFVRDVVSCCEMFQ